MCPSNVTRRRGLVVKLITRYLFATSKRIGIDNNCTVICDKTETDFAVENVSA